VHKTFTALQALPKRQSGGNLATASEDFFNICQSRGAAGEKPRKTKRNQEKPRDDRIDQRFREKKGCSEEPTRRHTPFFTGNALGRTLPRAVGAVRNASAPKFVMRRSNL
jgi:hypothetical protein